MTYQIHVCLLNWMWMKKLVKIKNIASYSKGSQINGDELMENAEYDYLNGGIKPSGRWNETNCEANTVTISEQQM